MNRYLRISLASAVVVGAFVGGTALAASATPVHHEPVCATWKMRGATGTYPAVVFGGKPAGSSISDYEAKLVKPTTGTDPGVEFAAKDVKVEAVTETLVGVDYVLSGGASTSAGAVRMFGYADKDANTLTDAPDWTAIATTDSGHLVLTVPAGKKLGTLGFAYDASNNTSGAVTVKNVTIGERKAIFTSCRPLTGPPSHPTKSPTVRPSTNPGSHPATPSASASSSASASASASSSSPPPVVAVSGPTLPLTGPPIGVLAGLAVLVAGTGVALTIAAKRRKVSFKA